MRGVPVCFVGLGPSDPRLRTERAAARLAEADVVLDAEVVAVEAVIELFRAGRRVVRPVLGDPFESPSIVAEMAALARAGVAIEIVPGVGSSAAAGAFAGVVGRAIAIRREEVARSVAGEPDDAPVTVIAAIGSPGQRTLVTTAARATDEVRILEGDGPLVLAFGAPDPALGWFERRPLFAKRVLVTRARAQASGAAELLRDHGAEPVIVPTIEIHPPADPQPLARALVRLRAGSYAWAAFTSANGVAMTWNALVAAGYDARAFGAARLAAIGPATARCLEAHGLRADVVAAEYRGEGLARDMLAAMPDDHSSSVLLARAAKARDVLPEALRAAGHTVDVVAAYETRPAPPETAQSLMRELDLGRIDAVTFTSSSTVDNLCDLLGSAAAELLRCVRVASIGPVTTASAQARGLRVDVTARTYTVPGLVEALAESYSGRLDAA
jgi:uroporphyrinogen III methyltransferase / synthase